VLCIECERIDLKNCDMAKHGCGRCRLDKIAAQSKSLKFPRDCTMFSAADPAVVAERAAWYDKRFVRGV
jgi:hypothetical protein